MKKPKANRVKRVITLKEAREPGQLKRFISEHRSLRADQSVFGRLLAAMGGKKPKSEDQT